MNYPFFLQNEWNYIKLKFNNKIMEFGKKYSPKADLIITGNSIELWDWTNNETYCQSHFPGVSIKSIFYLINKGCNEFIISQGYHNKLETQPYVKMYIMNLGYKIHVLNSNDAVEKWNQIIPKNKNLGMLLHSTC
jgi:hypothetical protein